MLKYNIYYANIDKKYFYLNNQHIILKLRFGGMTYELCNRILSICRFTGMFFIHGGGWTAEDKNSCRFSGALEWIKKINYNLKH